MADPNQSIGIVLYNYVFVLMSWSSKHVVDSWSILCANLTLTPNKDGIRYFPLRLICLLVGVGCIILCIIAHVINYKLLTAAPVLFVF
jgi:hypothetical protein